MARDSYSFLDEIYLRYENGIPLIQDDILQQIQQGGDFYLYTRNRTIDTSHIQTVLPHPQGPWTMVKVNDKWFVNSSQVKDWEHHLNELHVR
jgi:hypothetical protein